MYKYLYILFSNTLNTLNKEQLLTILKFNSLLSYLERNKDYVPNAIFGAMIEPDNYIATPPLTDRQVICIPLQLKQFAISKSFWFEDNKFIFNIPDEEIDFKWLILQFPNVIKDLKNGSFEFRIIETKDLLDEYIVENEVEDQAVGKTEKDLSIFTSITLPAVTFTDPSINLESLTSSETLEVIKLLHLFRTEVKGEGSRSKIFKFIKQQDLSVRSYDFYESNEDDEFGKPYLVVKIKYTSVVEYLIRMRAITIQGLKVYLGEYRKALSDFHSKFNNGESLKFEIHFSRVEDLYAILKEEVELENSTIIAELVDMLKGTVEYGGLEYQPANSLLNFKGENITLSPASQGGKFIKLLIVNKGNFVGYQDIAEAIGIYNPRFDDVPAHEAYGESIKYVRRNLIDKFQDTSNKEALKKLIQSSTKYGYGLIVTTN